MTFFPPFLGLIAVFYATNSPTVSNRVYEIDRSYPSLSTVSTPGIAIISNPALLPALPISNWKVSNNLPVLLSAADINALSNAATAAKLAAKKQDVKDFLTNSVAVESVVRGMMLTIRQMWPLTNFTQNQVLLSVQSNVLQIADQITE